MIEQKVYKYLISYYYGILNSYETGIANIIINTDLPSINGEHELEIIKNLISSGHHSDPNENDDREINPIILNIIPLPLEGK